MKNLTISIKLFVTLSLLTGVIYPALVTTYAKLFVSEKSNGSLVYKDGKAVASKLIGQRFQSVKYFWSRPSTTDYNGSSSGASNYGPTSQDLLKQYQDRALILKTAHSMNNELASIPQDLLFASGSGLDPHISPEAALFQVDRIASNRKVDVDQVRKLAIKFTETRQFGIFGDPRVNVVLLNMALDNDLKKE